MSFNRYDVLTTHYSKQIQQWDWNKLKKSLTDYEPEGFDARYDDPLVGVWIGTVLGMFPSGKIYALWTTNQTRSDVVKDECFSEALEEQAKKHGFFVDYCDGSIFLIRPKK